ncbi:hypothetical protein NK213_11880 [Sebaldella sp. S0638]|nr:hypothetical protein [Sebaldella sp. S0638]
MPIGIIKKTRNSAENWFDDKWKIPDINKVVNEFENFDFKLLKSLEINFSEEVIQKVIQKIVAFLNDAEKKNIDVYIDTY